MNFLIIEDKTVCVDAKVDLLALLKKESEINALMREEQYEQLLEELYIQEGISTKHQGSMPLKFMTAIMRYSTLRLTPSKCQEEELNDKYQQAILEYSLLKSTTSGIDNEEDLNEHYCCCSHPIHELYYVINKYNGNILLIGNDCINKFCPDNLQNMAHKLKKSLRRCKYCSNVGKVDEMFSGFCQDCVNKGYHNQKLKRACQTCLKFRISIKKPSYVTMCKKCYLDKKTQQEQDMRPCSECNELKIPKDKPEYVTYCTSCFKLKMRECISCHKLNIPRDKPKYVVRCTKCYVATKK